MPRGDDAERHIRTQTVQHLVHEPVAAEHPDGVARCLAGKLDRVAPPLGEQGLDRTQLRLHLPDALLGHPVRERVDDQRRPRH